MKPKRIFLIRHGESEANVDKKVLLRKPDFAVRLTGHGQDQVEVAAKAINGIIGDEPTAVYYSPFFRARDTAAILLSHLFVHKNFLIEDARLREQEWSGRLRSDVEMAAIQQERDAYGHFYYRFDTGESCADVFDRISDFFSTLHRDFEKDNFPKNVILVSHGMTMRLILMRWLHLSVEEFESLANPRNAEFWQLQKTSGHKYELVSSITKYRHARCKFVYPTNMGIPLNEKIVRSTVAYKG